MRADLAFHAGFFDDARAATDEAKHLDPDLPAVVEMEALLAAAPPDAALPLMVEAPSPTWFPAERAEKGRRVHYPFAFALACASVALIAAASFGWRAVLRPPMPPAVNASLRGNVTLPADPVLDTALGAPASAMVEPPPAETLEPEPAAISTSGETVPPVVENSHRADPVKSATATAPAGPDRTVPEGSPAVRLTAAAGTAPTPADHPGVPPAREEPVASLKAPVVEAVPLSAAVLPAPGSIPVAAPEPPPPSRTRAPEVAAPLVDAQAAIRTTLARYEAAYSGLNVSAARAVWPAVDQRALARAFDGLASQRVALDTCDVAVNGSTARATCSGSAEWTPKVGGGQRRQNRHWAFELANAGGTWQIVRADAR